MIPPAHSSIITKSSLVPTSEDFKCRGTKPLTDRRACNGPSNLSVEGNRELMKKSNRKRAKYRMTEDHDGLSCPRQFVTRVVDSDHFGQIFP